MTIWGTGLRWGIFTATALFFYQWFIHHFGWHFTWIGNLEWLFLAVGIYLAQRRYKHLQQGWLAYRQGILLGTFLAFVVGCCVGTGNYVYVRWVNPQLGSNLLDHLQASPAATTLGPLLTPLNVALVTPFMSSLVGLLYSALLTLFTQRTFASN